MRHGRHSSVEQPAPAAESLRDLMRWPQWILWRLIGFPLPPIDSSSFSITSSQAASPPSKRQKKRGKHDVTDDSLMVWQRCVTFQTSARRGLAAPLITPASTHISGALQPWSPFCVKLTQRVVVNSLLFALAILVCTTRGLCYNPLARLRGHAIPAT